MEGKEASALLKLITENERTSSDRLYGRYSLWERLLARWRFARMRGQFPKKAHSITFELQSVRSSEHGEELYEVSAHTSLIIPDPEIGYGDTPTEALLDAANGIKAFNQRDGNPEYYKAVHTIFREKMRVEVKHCRDENGKFYTEYLNADIPFRYRIGEADSYKESMRRSIFEEEKAIVAYAEAIQDQKTKGRVYN